MLKKITLSSIFILALVFGFFLVNGSNRAYAYKTDGACFWKDQGHIDCKYNTWVGGLIGGLQTLVDKAVFSPSEIPLIGGAFKSFDPAEWEKKVAELAGGSCTLGTADCDGYYFDPALSAAAGYAIFYAGNGTNPDAHAKYLHFVSGNPLFGLLSNQSSKIDPIPPDNDSNWIGLGGLNNANQWGDKNKCGLLNTLGCDIQDDGRYDIPMRAYDARPFLKTIEAIKSLAAMKQLCEQQAPLGFVLCPIYLGIVSSISGLIGGQGVSGPREGLLISFLTFSPLNSTKTGGPGGVDALQGIVSSIIALANSFYVIVFLILIFSSSLPIGLDNYTIKKTLPKFIAAVIMTQFAYVICGVIVDFFNLLGTIVPNIIFALPVGSDIGIEPGGGLSNLQKGLQAGIAGPLVGEFFLVFGWILIILFALIALVAIVVGFMYMILRYLVLFILILLAPIAFASWVLPGTEKFFSTWWKNFIRLNAMFPLITGMIAVSILISQTLLVSGEPNAAVKFIAMVVPIIALFLIPKTLKWTTAGMSAIAGGMMGAVAGKMGAGGKFTKDMSKKGSKKAWDAGKPMAQDKIAETKFGKTKAGRALVGGGLGALWGKEGTAGSRRRLASREAKIQAERNSEVAVQYNKTKAESKAAGMNDTQTARAIVGVVGLDRASQFALMALAAKAGDVETIEQLRATMVEKDWIEGVNANYQAFDGMPINRSFNGVDRVKDIQKLDHSGLVGMSGPAQAQIYSAGLGDQISLTVFTDAGDVPAERSKISRELLIEAHARAAETVPVMTGDPVADAAASKAHAISNPTEAKLLKQLNSDGTWQ